MAENINDESGNPKADVKTFTQDEVNSIISERLSKAKESNERMVAEAVAKAIEEERERQRTASLEGEDKLKATYDAQIKKQNEVLSKQQKELEQARLEIAKTKAEAQLAGLGLPVDFAVNLIGADDEATAKNIQTFSTAFNDAVAKAVNDNVARGTPKLSDSNANVPSWQAEIDKAMKIA